MVKWLAAGGLLVAVLVALLWQTTGRISAVHATPAARATDERVEPEHDDDHGSDRSLRVVAPEEPGGTATPALAPPRTAGAVAAPGPDTPADDPPTITRGSEAYWLQIDHTIPGKLMAAASTCWDAKLDQDAKVKFAIRYRVARDEVVMLDATVVESTLDATPLGCLRDAVRSARWRDRDLPDGDYDDELFIRWRGLKKHISDQERFDSDDSTAPSGE